MTKTNTGLVNWATAWLGQAYWYGTYCAPCTERLLESKSIQYPAHYPASRMPTYRAHIAAGKRCADCAGLIKGYLWSDESGRVTYDSNGFRDINANGMYSAAKVKGAIKAVPDAPGLLVWYDGHIGVYIGGGEVIEARGFDYGVVRTKLGARPWTHWLECPNIAYTVGIELTSNPTLRKGDRGSYVMDLQTMLIERGFSLPKYGVDGDFGEETERAVKAFQNASKLDVDGIAGPKTWAALTTAKPAMFRLTILSGDRATLERARAEYGGEIEEVRGDVG